VLPIKSHLQLAHFYRCLKIDFVNNTNKHKHNHTHTHTHPNCVGARTRTVDVIVLKALALSFRPVTTLQPHRKLLSLSSPKYRSAFKSSLFDGDVGVGVAAPLNSGFNLTVDWDCAKYIWHLSTREVGNFPNYKISKIIHRSITNLTDF